MKKSLLLLAALVSAPFSLVAADVASQIKAVTVYTDRAVVTRAGTIDLTPGITELVFSALPASLIDQSLQVSGSGTARVTILDVTARQTFLPVTPDPRRHDLEQQITELKAQDRTLLDRLAVLHDQHDLIKQLQNATVAPGTGEKSERPKLDDVKSVLAYGREQLLKLAADVQELEQQRSDLQDKITALQNQLNALQGPGRRSVKTVTVRVDAASAGSLDLRLSYTVPGASWTPGYDARVLTGENRVALAYFGNVRQATGEDWNNVALTLSTARPSLGGAAPELSPWNLDVFVPRTYIAAQDKQSVVREMPAARNMTLVAGAGEREPEVRDAFMAQASVDTAATSATFKIATPTTIASDGSVQKVPVTEVPLQAEMSYATTPKLREAAFLTAKVVNTSDYPLLAGAMNVFLDGTFVASSRLDTTMPGEKFDLALGADEGISVKRERTRKYAEETGVFSKDHRLTYEYRITVQNNKRTPVKITVDDQVPVSRNEKIVVKVTAPKEEEAKPDAEGKLQWKLDLQPGEKRELTIKFTIDYPKDVNVTGLE